jgi:alanine racemase
MLHRVYTSDEITKVINATLFSKNKENIAVKDILVDSRRLISPDGTLFFALVTKHNDGHKFVEKLYNRGVKYFVISKKEKFINNLQNASFFVVKDTLKALQDLAAFHRKQFNIPVIGITGSNGKTIIKEWLFQLLSPDKHIVRSPKSYNSQIGVPLSVWQINNTHDIAIFEAGISEPNEMDKLQPVINPTIGIFTNIGDAHSENFISKKQKTGEKLKLFTHSESLIYCSDHKDIKEVLISSEILKKVHSFSWGKESINRLIIKNVDRKEKFTTINGIYNNESISIEIPFIDSASVENATHCWALMLLMNYDNDVVAQRMKELQQVAMRLELKEGINNCSIINDAYNSDINSLNIAIDFLSQQNQHEEKVVILSDILQTGIPEYELYSKVNDLLISKGISKLIGIGHIISRNSDKFTLESYFFPSTKVFLANYPMVNFSHQTILLKGARVFEFEQINNLLQQKLHETVLEINLNNLVSNLNYFKSLLKRDTQIMAMVKAFSYGSGSFEIANILQYHNINYLAVAYADEGVDLRKAGINIPIMVMNPEENAFDTMIKYQLEPEIFSFRALQLLERTISTNALPENKPVKIHIKLDTGMHRLGFNIEEIETLIKKIKSNKQIFVQSIFSHLSGSDKPELDYFTKQQIELFQKMSKHFDISFNHHITKHILNSAGIIRFPEAHFDMVRIGIGMYGTEDINNTKLKNVISFKSTISQIKKIKKGESVSYNRSWIANNDTTIGIIAVGYADGLMRKLGNGKISLWIKDKPAQVLGDICMDMCIVDLSGIDASEGDEVIVFDAKHKVSEFAEKAGTISYEILSRISSRVKRVYYYE